MTSVSYKKFKSQFKSGHLQKEGKAKHYRMLLDKNFAKLW